MNGFIQFFADWGSELLSVSAFWVSIVALRQTSAHRRSDIWVRARTRAAETVVLLDSINQDVSKLKEEWWSHFAAAGNYQSGARLSMDGALERISTEAESLRLQLPVLPDRPPRLSSRKLEQDLAALESVYAQAMNIRSEVGENKARLIHAGDVRRTVQARGSALT